MFGNGRARSGIIVLPCGAGKTLTGVTASQTIKKSVICLCTNAVSVLQWKYQFKLWTNIPEENISIFTSDKKDDIHPGGCVLITTYTMISYGGQRSDKSAEVMKAIEGRECKRFFQFLLDLTYMCCAHMICIQSKGGFS